MEFFKLFIILELKSAWRGLIPKLKVFEAKGSQLLYSQIALLHDLLR